MGELGPVSARPEVGDYGVLDKENGQFDKHGNIYDEDFAKCVPGIDLKQKQYKASDGAHDTEIHIKSGHILKVDLGAGVEMDTASLATASINGTWKFTGGSGAMLFMTKPCIKSIPPGTILKHLAEVPALKDKYLVTEVSKCPAYALYLSTKGEDEVTLALKAGLPATVPGLTATASGHSSWSSISGSGTLKQGGDPNGKDIYTPIFRLQKIRNNWLSRWFRDSPPPEPVGDEVWEDARAPWAELDDEGHEEEVVADYDLPDW